MNQNARRNSEKEATFLVEILQLTEWICLPVLFYSIYLSPLSKGQATAGKNLSVNIPTIMYTCALPATSKNTNLIWKSDALALYLYNETGARVQTKI